MIGYLVRYFNQQTKLFLNETKLLNNSLLLKQVFIIQTTETSVNYRSLFHSCNVTKALGFFFVVFSVKHLPIPSSSADLLTGTVLLFSFESILGLLDEGVQTTGSGILLAQVYLQWTCW